MDSNSMILMIVAACTLGAFVLGALALLAQAPTRVEQRLSVLARGDSPSSTMAVLLKDSLANDGRLWVSLWKWLRKLLSLELLFTQAGVTLTAQQMLLAASTCAALVGSLALWLRLPPLLFLPMVAASLTIPVLVLHYLRFRRLRRFAKQLPDALELLARSLRAGNSLVSACQTVSGDMLGPVAEEFGVFCKTQSLGTSMEQGLEQFCSRVPSDELRFFANCVLMQRDLGGNLAEICEKIANIVRDRFRIMSQVHALTGEGRLSGVVLMALPFALFVALYFLSPGYIELLFIDQMGRKMLGGAIALQIVGAVVIQKLMNIDA